MERTIAAYRLRPSFFRRNPGIDFFFDAPGFVFFMCARNCGGMTPFFGLAM
jgi:hypothetical protein